MGNEIALSKRTWSRRGLVDSGIAGAALLAACGPLRGVGQQEPDGPRALRTGARLLWLVSTGQQQVHQALETIGADFQALHPGLQVETLNVATGYYDKLQTMLAAGTPPDVFWIQVREFPSYVMVGHLAHLDPLVRRDRHDVDDFFERLIRQYLWAGRLHALPWDLGFRAIFYNQDLFEAAGVPFPPGDWKAGGWTFADFLEAAQRLTRTDSGGLTRYGHGNATDFWPWIYANGGRLINEDNTQGMLDRKEAIESLQFLQDLMHKHRVAPTLQEMQELAPARAFMAGRAAMLTMAAAPASLTFRQITEFRWDAAAMPRGPSLRGERRTHGGGSGWGLAGRSPQPEESWALFKHVTSKAASERLASVGWSAPRKSVANSPLWLDPNKPPKSKAIYRNAAQHIVTNPHVLTWDDFFRVVSDEFDRIWRGEVTASEAGARIGERTRPVMQRHVELVQAAKAAKPTEAGRK